MACAVTSKLPFKLSHLSNVEVTDCPVATLKVALLFLFTCNVHSISQKWLLKNMFLRHKKKKRTKHNKILLEDKGVNLSVDTHRKQMSQ